MPQIKDILDTLQAWAPPAVAWERDNIGVLVGDAAQEVTRVLVCLDITPEVVEEAVREGAQLIVAHHPVIFHPLKSLRTDAPQGALLAALLTHGIGVIAAHTNADAARGGLNHELARRLGLTDVSVLDPAQGQQRRLWLRLPRDPALIDTLLAALRDTDNADAVQSGGDDDSVTIEVTAPSWRVRIVRSLVERTLGDLPFTLSEARLEGPVPEYGIGAVGTLGSALPVRDFLSGVKSALGCEMLRVSTFEEEQRIRRVAVCSGAGSSYIRSAMAAGADALVTGDLTHHYFLDHRDGILLVDAGHFHTERLFIELCAGMLEKWSFENSKKIDILQARTNTNPICFV
ncbi:MAG: Nif3-like dinuclear metal center hexameric protein [Bacteroidetes bacterium]|nr:Nif3-like dinuclear metal center hexameric protein [Bacteroidota bacterium]